MSDLSELQGRFKSGIFNEDEAARFNFNKIILIGQILD
jgi:hypothetical protein